MKGIRTATPTGLQPLCESCRYGLVIRGAAVTEEIAFCHLAEPSFRVPFRVRECTGYSDRNQAQLYEMEDAARVIEVPLSRIAGFRLPAKPDTSPSEG